MGNKSSFVKITCIPSKCSKSNHCKSSTFRRRNKSNVFSKLKAKEITCLNDQQQTIANFKNLQNDVVAVQRRRLVSTLVASAADQSHLDAKCSDLAQKHLRKSLRNGKALLKDILSSGNPAETQEDYLYISENIAYKVPRLLEVEESSIMQRRIKN